MRRSPIFLLSFALLVILLLLSNLAVAQEARGTISGRVVDSSKAVVAGATVVVEDVARGTSVTLATNAEGLFRAPYLLPGSYRITAEASGFKKYVRSGITLQMNETRDVEVPLEVGGATEMISVVADAPVLQTSEASMGQNVDTRRVAELPLVHGDPYTLMALSPGATFSRDPRLDRPFEPTHIVGFTVDGTRANRSDLTIDGIPSTARANGNEVIASYVPPTDIIEEFKVQTATFDAQFGNTEGGVTSIGIKSGTNTFHGTGYFWEEPGGLAANDYIANSKGQKRPFTYSNRYGLTGSGPVIIPKLYNGKNRTFWTFGWEGIRDARPRYDSTTPTVPTDAMMNGDFSAFLALGPQYQIYNPFTRRVSTPGHYVEDPFPGNIIPQNLINPVSKGLLKYWGHAISPYTPGTAFLGNNTDSTLAEKTLGYDTFTIRLDHSLTDRQKIFGRASWYGRKGYYDDYFHTLATGVSFQFMSRQGMFDYVNTVNATTVLNVRYGYNRFVRAQDLSSADAYGFDLTSVGFPAAYNNAIPQSLRRFPRIDFPAGTYQGTGSSGEYRPNDLHSIVATLNKSIGSHYLRTGVEFRSYRQNDIFTSNENTGRFTFDNTYTKQTDTATAQQPGLSFAAFLLGLPTGGSGSYVNVPASFAEQSVTWGVFVQDDWKLRPNLTVNLGLRYELEQPMTERFNRSVSGFDSSYSQPIQAAVQAKYASAQTPEVPASQLLVRGGLMFPGVNGGSALYETPKKNFMPRIGLAYSLTPKTVIRAGYGIFFGFLGQRRGDVIQSGFSQTTSFIPTTNQLDASGHVIFSSTLSNPFPNGITQPVGNTLGKQTFLGQTITFFNQHPLAPYMQRWELGVQRELPLGIVVEGAYVGNRGTHIEISRNLNVTPQQYLSTSARRDPTKISYLTQSLANPFYGILPSTTTIGGSTTIARERLLRAYPEFDAVNTTTNDGYSWYHSGQFRASKRMALGLTAGVSYTWSKFMQATELLNQDDLHPWRGISDYDYPHRVSVNWLYELPFGEHKQLLNDRGWLVSRVLFGGWQMQGVFTHQSGAPIGFGNLIYNGDLHNIELPSDQRTLGQWFTTVQPTTNTDPNAPGWITNSSVQLDHNVRTFPLRFSWVRADGMHNIDASLIKNTSINERMKVQLRFEAINAFNHPLFPAPSTNIASFGKITNTNQANYPRRIQMGAKFIF